MIVPRVPLVPLVPAALLAIGVSVFAAPAREYPVHAVPHGDVEREAGLETGKYEGRRFNDTDIYKRIEASSYSLRRTPDEALSPYVAWAKRGPGEMAVWVRRGEASTAEPVRLD